MINGIPVQIKAEDKDGNLTQVETIYFPTFRKCPKLAQFPKAIARQQTVIQKARRRLELANEALETAKLEEIDATGEKVDAANDELLAADDKMFKQFHDFIRTGLKAAGYQDPEIERFMEHIDVSRLDELVQCSRMGAGRVAFFSAETPVPKS